VCLTKVRESWERASFFLVVLAVEFTLLLLLRDGHIANIKPTLITFFYLSFLLVKRQMSTPQQKLEQPNKKTSGSFGFRVKSAKS